MAETHQEIVKVWIAPGCIVCDACETDCPEVFDVQEETCVIRPDAQNAEFTKPLTPSIIVAAEGCPVDVIKYETVEVEGPEPWAGQEQEAQTAAAATGGGGAAKKAGPVIPEGPPDPKWAGLLSHSRITARRKVEEGETVTATATAAAAPVRAPRPSAKVSAQAIAEALPGDVPPDARVAAMVGTGYVRPRANVAKRIRERAGVTRRDAVGITAGVSAVLFIAWGAMAGTLATALGALQSFMVPKLTKEPPTQFSAGRLSDYPEDGVYEQFKGSQQTWIVRQRGKLFALSTICTHLGCIPNWLGTEAKFKCPCHGSGFYMDGVNFEGPANRPLERFRIDLDGDTIVIDKAEVFRSELGQWGQPGSELLI